MYIYIYILYIYIITNSFRGGDCQEERTGIVLDRKKGIPAEVNSVASYVNSAVL